MRLFPVRARDAEGELSLERTETDGGPIAVVSFPLDLEWCMTDRSRGPISFAVEIRAEHPELLRGLDLWLQLGLISDIQVRRLAMSQLCCQRPIPEPQRAIDRAAPTSASLRGEFVLTAESERANLAVPERTIAHLPPHPSLLAQILSSFMAEISVVWLLFLGVFLVVVSSAVLAASQWQNVSPVGQYGILWGYTIAFGFAGLWTASKENLRLTSRMLQVTTLLIIPVNFWMMDGFRLWSDPIGWGMGLLATVTLSGLQFWLLRSSSRLSWLNTVGLSWLHWGWSLPGLPLLATYVGTIGTAVLQVRDRGSSLFSSRALRQVPAASMGDSGGESDALSDSRALRESQKSQATPTPRLPWDLGPVTIAFATLLLMGRATLAAQVPIGQLGLALGMCGWLVLWERRSTGSTQPVQATTSARSTDTRSTQEITSARSTETPLWSWVGMGLLLLGWLVAVTDQQLWQALGCSGLGLGLLWDRLHQRWQKLETVGLLLVGVQAYALLRVIFPPTLRSWIMAQVAAWVQLELGAWELTGLGFFPCLLLMLGFAIYLDRRDRRNLGHLTRQVTLAFGLALAVPGLLNPGVRALYGGLSSVLLLAVLWQSRDRGDRASSDPETLRLGTVPHQPSTQTTLIYLTHLNSVLTGVFWVVWLAPNLEAWVWTAILLASAVLEWLVCWRTNRAWQISAWAIGWGFACVGYLALLVAIVEQPQFPMGGLMGLGVPGMLVGLGRSRSFPYRVQAHWLSVATVLLTLGFTAIDRDVFLLGLSVGTALLWLQTQALRNLGVASLTIGSGLLLLTIGLLRVQPALPEDWWAVWIGMVLWGLGGVKWLLERQLPDLAPDRAEGQRSLPLLFRTGIEFWTIALVGISFWNLTQRAAMTGEASLPMVWNRLLGIGVTTLAIGLFHRLTNLTLLGIAWGVELGIVFLADQTPVPNEFRAIVNIGFALALQLGVAWWRAQRLSDRLSDPSARSARSFLAWDGIPVVYAAIGVGMGHAELTASTGLYTLAGMLPWLGVGRRRSDLKFLTYLGLVGISIGAYELLLYQLMTAPAGGAIGDAVVLLAGLAMLLAWIDRLLSGGWSRYLGLESAEMRGFGHLHWAVASLLAIFALLFDRSGLGGTLWMGTVALLAIYAIEQGRRDGLWIYPGVLQLWATIGYGLTQWLPDRVLLDWSGAIAAVLGFVTYAIPWRNWGWADRPWRFCAIGLPALVLVLTAEPINVPSLLMIAALYAWIAWKSRMVRLSYLSLALAIWSAFRLFLAWQFSDPLWYVSVFSLAMLYVVQVDPDLQSQTEKEQRHWLRCLAIGLLSLTAFYQSEASWIQGLLTISLGIGFGILGLIFRVRAFLYVGTLTFILKVLRQLWLFISDYSLLLWGLGIVLGLALIWIAATFEARRSQAIALMQYWITELDAWE